MLKYRKDGKLHWVATDNGVFEMSGNRLRIMADSAERGEDINVLRAKEAYDRAMQRLEQKHDGWTISGRNWLSNALWRG